MRWKVLIEWNRKANMYILLELFNHIEGSFSLQNYIQSEKGLLTRFGFPRVQQLYATSVHKTEMGSTDNTQINL